MTAQKIDMRYDRQLRLKEFGEDGQNALLRAKVLVIGAGGLGCPVLQYLAAAGVGTIGIVDDDTVSLHNLHRQPLYTVEDTGWPKAEVAARRLRQLNPAIEINSYNERLTTSNALEIIGLFDVVVDGSDNFPTRYLVNDACVLLNKPLIYGAVSATEGQLAVFNTGIPRVNYRDIFPQQPKDGEVLNCVEAGVLGVLPGVIGLMMANETIKLIASMGKPLINQLLTWNALTNQSYEMNVQPVSGTSKLIPSTPELFKLQVYDPSCETEKSCREIDREEFDELIGQPAILFIDVREMNEYPEVEEFAHEHIPLSSFQQQKWEINADTVVLFCQSGIRSRQAADFLATLANPRARVLSLKGGITSWKKMKQKEHL